MSVGRSALALVRGAAGAATLPARRPGGGVAREGTRLAVRACAPCILLNFLVLPLVAQEPERADSAAPDSTAQAAGARLTGYLEHQFGAARERGRWTQLDYDRVRLDLAARAGRGTRVSAAAVWQLYRGDTRVRLRDQLPSEFGPLVDTTSVVLEDRRYVNHAYVAFSRGGVEITAGKQFLTWGAAWVFNPTELFRPKDIFEPTYEREGVGALSARVPLAALGDVLVAYVPDGSFRTSGKILRARYHVAGFDVSGLAAAVYETPAALGGAPAAPQRRLVLGGDLSGEVLGLGVWAEGTWSERAGERWGEATLGGNTTLGDGTLLMVEGYFNGRGTWGEPYAAAAWLGRLAGERRSLGRLVLFGSASRQYGDLWRLGVAALVNPGDGSAVMIPSVSYEFAENVELSAEGVVSTGRDGTEYGSGTAGGFVRARVYF